MKKKEKTNESNLVVHRRREKIPFLLARLSSDVLPLTYFTLVDVDEVVETFPLVDAFLRLLSPLFLLFSSPSPLALITLFLLKLEVLFFIVFLENHEHQPQNVIFFLRLWRFSIHFSLIFLVCFFLLCSKHFINLIQNFFSSMYYFCQRQSNNKKMKSYTIIIFNV